MSTDVGSEINGHNQSVNRTEPPVSLQVDAGDSNRFLMTGLNEYTLYVFEIFASTRIGSGPSAWETVRTHHTRKPYKSRFPIPCAKSVTFCFTLLQIHMLHLKTFRSQLQVAEWQLLAGTLLPLNIRMASLYTTCC